MKRLYYYLTYALFAGLFFIVACSKSDAIRLNDNLDQNEPKNGEIIPGKYIVTLSNEVMPDARFKVEMNFDERIEMAGNISAGFVENVTGEPCEIDYAYHAAMKGFAAALSDNQLEKLKEDPRVVSIEPDRFVVLAPPPGKGPGNNNGGGGDDSDPEQETPWGITRVGGTPGNYNGTKVAWIIDTGIDLDHPDLNVDVARSASFLNGKDADDPNDGHGHGTHVAGTVAAIDNLIGVIGVAPGASVVSVRVLNRRGSGTSAGVIAGINYVADNAAVGDVANMSLGGGAYSPIDNAVINAAAKGILFALAAGNESDHASNHSPARANHANIYTISAMNSSDNFASFSNYGNPPIDYCEPGVSIFSCWKNGGYNTISGTSMACPHMAGILIMTNGAPQSGGTVNNDPDGNADTIGVIQ